MIVISFAGDERVLSLERVLRGKFKGDLQYHEVPLVGVLPPSTRTTRELVLNVLPIAVHKGPDTQVDLGPSGIGVDNVSATTLHLF